MMSSKYTDFSFFGGYITDIIFPDYLQTLQLGIQLKLLKR